MHDTISLKTYTLSWQYFDSEIIATISYWSKSYTVTMLEPYHAMVGEASLMYAIPTHYGVIESDEEQVGHTINLVPVAKKLCEQWLSQNIHQKV